MRALAIGCSGFSYKHWRGVFYPEDLPQKKWFDYYCTIFDTVELNVTFYRLPSPATFTAWHRQTPPGFVFAIKGSRFITHIKKLKETEEPLKYFFEAASHLGDKLTVVLWQLPPSFPCDAGRLGEFLGLLQSYPVHHVFEFRHGSWLNNEVVALCRQHNAALCMADAPDFLKEPPITGSIIYLRRHGHTGNYTGCYTRDQLEQDARRIREYRAAGHDVHIYFNNDIGGYAPRNAQELRELLV